MVEFWFTSDTHLNHKTERFNNCYILNINDMVRECDALKPNGTRGTIKCFCIICGEYIGNFYPSQTRQTCSKNCYKKLISNSIKGKNNPNYGNKWLEEEKEVSRQRALKWHRENKENFLEINRNRRPFSEQARKNMGKAHIGISHSHTEKSKKIIGIKSKEKWTPDFKMRFRKTMEELGYWIPLKDKDPYKNYKVLSNWNQRMWDLFPNNSLLGELGIFGQSNPNGCVRDHKYSRKSGFKAEVFPVLIRHPINCQILTRIENIKKFWRGEDDISLEELFTLIENYSNEWHEQNECLNTIKRYRSGERFDLMEVI